MIHFAILNLVFKTVKIFRQKATSGIELYYDLVRRSVGLRSRSTQPTLIHSGLHFYRLHHDLALYCLKSIAVPRPKME